MDRTEGKRPNGGGLPKEREENGMVLAIRIIVIAAAVIAALFVLSFLVYFFNLDMKLTAKLAPLFEKHYDKIDRDKHL